MSTMEEAMLNRVQPLLITAKAEHIMCAEMKKGCLPHLYPQPVALEPVYEPIGKQDHAHLETELKEAVFETKPSIDQLQRFTIWLTPDYHLDWRQNELFLKQLYSVSNRIGLEIGGNQDQIQLSFLCHQIDCDTLTAVFHGHFDPCALTPIHQIPLQDFDLSSWDSVSFYDFLPPPPYSHLLTRPQEFPCSPYEAFMNMLSQLPSHTYAFCQILFQPVQARHNWHRNVEILQDLEYTVKLMGNVRNPQLYSQQAPSGDLHHMAQDTDSKAHNDKPFFCAAFRILVMDRDEQKKHLHTLATLATVFQHGGRPFAGVSHADYRTLLSSEQIQEMFTAGLTYRPGFLLNSWELVGLAHFPEVGSLLEKRIPIFSLDPLTLNADDLSNGTKNWQCITVGGGNTHSYLPFLTHAAYASHRSIRHGKIGPIGADDTGRYRERSWLGSARSAWRFDRKTVTPYS